MKYIDRINKIRWHLVMVIKKIETIETDEELDNLEYDFCKKTVSNLYDVVGQGNKANRNTRKQEIADTYDKLFCSFMKAVSSRRLAIAQKA